MQDLNKKALGLISAHDHLSESSLKPDIGVAASDVGICSYAFYECVLASYVCALLVSS
jgi:hypothetical protein